MASWYRNLQALARQLGKTRNQTNNTVTEFSSTHLASASSFGKTSNIYRTWDSSTMPTHPFHQYLQHSGISSSRILNQSSSDATPSSSPLRPVLAITSGEDQGFVSKPSTVKAILKKIKQSPKKVNLVAALVRGMRVEDALLQLELTQRRATNVVYQAVQSARANASHNHGLNPNRLIIVEAFVGKGNCRKAVTYHAKGRSGIKTIPECRLTVVLREITTEEETKIARLRVERHHHLSKKESRLIPHILIEKSSIWDRRGKADQNGEGSAALSPQS